MNTTPLHGQEAAFCLAPFGALRALRLLSFLPYASPSQGYGRGVVVLLSSSLGRLPLLPIRMGSTASTALVRVHELPVHLGTVGRRPPTPAYQVQDERRGTPRGAALRSFHKPSHHARKGTSPTFPRSIEFRVAAPEGVASPVSPFAVFFLARDSVFWPCAVFGVVGVTFGPLLDTFGKDSLVRDGMAREGCRQ